jgi:DNA-binding transcriptional ArsR family regulator
MVEPDRRDTLDLDALRLLAHPLRRRMEKELRKGPVTATSLAKALGESSGLTSYHLRELAKHGFVEEVPELAKGRERWWRFVPRDRRFPPRREQSPEMRAVVTEVQRQTIGDDFARFLRAQEDADDDDPWADAFPFSLSTIDVSLAEFRQFFEDYIALLYRYKDRSAGNSRTVQVRFFAYPESPTEDG